MEKNKLAGNIFALVVTSSFALVFTQAASKALANVLNDIASSIQK